MSANERETRLANVLRSTTEALQAVIAERDALKAIFAMLQPEAPKVQYLPSDDTEGGAA